MTRHLTTAASMSVKNIIFLLVISTWPILSGGHLTLQTTSVSSMIEEEPEKMPVADAYTNAKPYNLSNLIVQHEESTKRPAEDFFGGDDPPLLVSYELFHQYCEITGSQLRCESDDQRTIGGSTWHCFPNDTSSLNHKFLTKDDKNFYNLTEAVFRGPESSSCFGGPLLLNGFLSNLKSLTVSEASDDILDVFTKAIKIKRQFRSLVNLSLISNNITKQKKLDQIFLQHASSDDQENTTSRATLFPNLEKLDLSGNNFVILNLSPFYKIPLILLNECPKLTTITVQGVTSQNRIFALEELRLSRNAELTTVSPWIIPSSPNLTSLDLSLNPRLQVFPTSFFSSSLLDRVNLDNSSFICDCNLENSKNEVKFYQHLLEKDCTDVRTNSEFKKLLKTRQFLASSCSSNPSSQTVTNKEDTNNVRNTNITAFVNTDVVINCHPNSFNNIGGEALALAKEEDDNDTPIATHTAWITPTNDILVWIRGQFAPESDVRDSNVEVYTTNTTMEPERIQVNSTRELISAVQVLSRLLLFQFSLFCKIL